MIYLILLALVLAANIWFLKDKYGYTLCLILSYSIILSFLISESGLSGLKLIILYALYLCVIIKGISEKTITLKADPLFYSVAALCGTVFISNFLVKPYWSPARIESVNTYQVQFLINVITPYVVTLFVLTNIKRRVIGQFIKSMPYWGALFIVLVFFMVNLSEIDFNDRMSITEQSGLSTITLSRYFAIIFISSLILFMDQVKKDASGYIKVTLLFITFASFFYLFLVGQRGTILGVILGLFFFFAFNLNKENRTQIISIFLLVFIGVYAVIEFNIFGLFDRFANLKDYQSFERYLDYFNSWDIFKSNSFFLPEGSLGYQQITGRSYPHNIILECMVEYGLIGLVSSLLIFIFGGICSFKILKNKDIPVIFKIVPVVWIAQGVSALISANILGAQLFLVFTALLTVVQNQIKKKIYVRIQNRIYRIR